MAPYDEKADRRRDDGHRAEERELERGRRLLEAPAQAEAEAGRDDDEAGRREITREHSVPRHGWSVTPFGGRWRRFREQFPAGSGHRSDAPGSPRRRWSVLSPARGGSVRIRKEHHMPSSRFDK